MQRVKQYVKPAVTPRLSPDTVAPERRMAEVLLDATHEQFARYRITAGMDALFDGLAALRRTLPPEAWQRVVHEQCRAHPLRALVHESPLARRAFEKPRGYAGDAETLDFVYGDVAVPPLLSARGAAVYAYEVQMHAATSVRARRDILAALIDRVAGETDRPSVLSVACGHLREASQAAAVRERRLAAFHALDQDEVSLGVVERTHAGVGVVPVRGSVRSLLTGASTFEGLDLVYAAGLYDYLELPVAARLTARMFGMLRPGGRLLVANFARKLRDAGFMEAFMDWTLIYRDESDVERFAELVPASEVASQRLFRDPPGNVVYLELRRA